MAGILGENFDKPFHFMYFIAMDKNKNIEVFENAPVPRAVLKFAVPTVLSMIVSVFYNMVDSFFVGLIGDPSQFAAVNVATPVFLFLMAAGNIFGMGGSSFLSRALGEKKMDKVKATSAFCFYAGIAVGIAGGAAMLAFMSPILGAVGTTETTFGFAREYLSIIALAGPVIVVSTAFTNIIRGEGASSSSMAGIMAGTAANIILDPIFILDSFLGVPLLGMGVAGAAIATVIGNAVTLTFYAAHVISKKSLLSINPRRFRLRGIAGGVIAIGLPASLTNILMSLSAIVTNKLLASYYATPVGGELAEAAAAFVPSERFPTFGLQSAADGTPIFGDAPTAAMGVAFKANMLVIFVQLGLGMGIAPLIGYNYGAGNIARLRSVVKFSVALNVVLGVLLTAVYFVFARPIVAVFQQPPAVEALGVQILHALMVSTPVIGIMFVLNFTFQAMGKAAQSLALAVSRQGFVFLPLILVLNRLFGLEGIVYAQPVADGIAVLIAVAMFAVTIRRVRLGASAE